VLTSVTLDNSSGSAVTLHSESGTRQIRNASGLAGIGALRASTRPRPQAHGSINETRFEDGRLIVLEGAVWSQVSQAAAWTEFDAITKPMMQTLDVGPALLKWTRSGGLALQRRVKLASEVDPPIEEGAAMLRYQAQFIAEDPRAYSQTETTATGAVLSQAAGGKVYSYTYARTYNPSGGGEASVSNLGTRPTPPTFKVYGYCTSPEISLVGQDGVIVLTGEIANGDYIEIDCAARTVKLNGTTNRLNLLDAASTTWFELPTGSSTVQLLAGTFDASARCDVIYRAAY